MGVAGEHDVTEAHRGPRHLVLRRGRAPADALIVKTIAPGHPAASALAAGLQREHDLLAGLSVPGAARPLGMSELEGQPALLLADAGPLNLKQWLRRRPLPADRFLALAVQLAETLARLHELHL